MNSPTKPLAEHQPRISPRLIRRQDASGRVYLTWQNNGVKFRSIEPSSPRLARQERPSLLPSSKTGGAVTGASSVNGTSTSSSLTDASLSDTPVSDDTAIYSSDGEEEDEEEEEEEEEEAPERALLTRLAIEGGRSHFLRSTRLALALALLHPPPSTASSHGGTSASAGAGAAARKRKQGGRDAAAAALENERIGASVGSVNKLAPQQRAVAQLRVAGMDGGRDGEMAVRAMMDIGAGKRRRKRTWRAVEV